MSRGAKMHALESNDFLESIRVIRICQNFFGACRVSIRGSDIRTRCWVQNIGLLCWACVATGFYYLALTIDQPTDISFSSVAVNVCLSAFFFYCEIFIIVATSEDMVYVMKICQDIGSSFPKLKTSNIYKDWFTYITTFAIIQYLVRGFNIATYIYSKNMQMYTTRYGFNAFVSYLSELDILMWVKICDYLRDHLRNMNVVLREKSKCTYSHNFNGQKYLFIFERCTFCFIYVLKLYRWTIIFFYANFLIWTITAFRNLTAAGYTNDWDIIAYTFLKKMVFITAISCTTEMFIKVCEDIEQTCYDILDNHDKGELKELADTVLYLLKEMPPTTQIAGMLHLDFKLFFQFVAQLISYTVIILQFSNFKHNNN